jgi:hypothetical protein
MSCLEFSQRAKFWILTAVVLDSYVDTATIKPMEVVNRKKITHSKLNAWEVSVVLLTKCPEPFAGIGYN